MIKITKNVLLTGAILLVGHAAMAGTGTARHFHAACAFDSCQTPKDQAEILARLPHAAEMLQLEPEWKNATVQVDSVKLKDDVMQFTAWHPNKKDKKVFSFKKNGVLLGAKNLN